MTNKFSMEDLVIRIMPGGFFLAIVFVIFKDSIGLNLVDNLDFLYTFLFFCSAYIVGELLQTIVHETEWIIDIFFKFRRPSKVFLYKNNPVLKSGYTRNELIKHLNLSEKELKIINQEYSNIRIFSNRKREEDDLSQSIFWKLYLQVKNTEEIKMSNRNYLFTRVIMVEFLLISILFYTNANNLFWIGSLLVSLIFLWRSRGIARGLVYKTVLMNLKK